MNSPVIRPRNNKPAVAPDGKTGPQQALRVMSGDGAARPAAPSIAMPRAKTELSELLAGDDALCVRRRSSATATRQTAEARSDVPDVHAEPQIESPPTAAVDGDLTRVIDAWPGLPRNVRAAVLALIRETATGGHDSTPCQTNLAKIIPSAEPNLDH